MSAALFALNRRSALGWSLRSPSKWVVRQQRCLGTTVSSDMQDKQRLSTIRLYRILQRTCKSFPVDSKEDLILLQPELKAPDWGQHSIFIPPSPTIIEELYRLFYVYNDDAEDNAAFAPSSIDDWYSEVVGKVSDEDLPPVTTMTCWTTTEQLQQAVRSAFRLSYNLDSPALHKWAIRAIHLLQEQRTMWRHSSVATTEQIRVTATSRCIGMSSAASALVPAAVSSMLESKHRFAYRIRVENVSADQHVQLLGRYWHIQDATEAGEPDTSKEPVVLNAPVTGAVGHLPVLRPGQVFEYMSGTDLSTSRGVMKGHFYMARVPEDTISAKTGDVVEALKLDDKLEVAVAPFPLAAD